MNENERKMKKKCCSSANKLKVRSFLCRSVAKYIILCAFFIGLFINVFVFIQNVTQKSLNTLLNLILIITAEKSLFSCALVVSL